jgi:hypothetical protein
MMQPKRQRSLVSKVPKIINRLIYRQMMQPKRQRSLLTKVPNIIHWLIHRKMMQPKRQQDVLRKLTMPRQMLIMSHHLVCLLVKPLLKEALRNLREDRALQ